MNRPVPPSVSRAAGDRDGSPVRAVRRRRGAGRLVVAAHRVRPRAPLVPGSRTSESPGPARSPSPDTVVLAAIFAAGWHACDMMMTGAARPGSLKAGGGPETVYLAYTVNRPSYGSTTIEDPALLAAELSRLGIRTYLMFNDEALAERLKQSDGFRPLAELSMIPRATPPATLAAFEVPERSAGR